MSSQCWKKKWRQEGSWSSLFSQSSQISKPKVHWELKIIMWKVTKKKIQNQPLPFQHMGYTCSHIWTQTYMCTDKERGKGLDLTMAMQRLNQEAFIKNLMYTECWTCLLMSTMLSVLKEFETLCRRQTDRWVVMIQKPTYPWRVKTLDRVQGIIAQRGWEFIEILFKQKQCLAMGEDLQAQLGVIDPILLHREVRTIKKQGHQQRSCKAITWLICQDSFPMGHPFCFAVWLSREMHPTSFLL